MTESLHEMAKRMCDKFEDCDGCPVDCGYQYCAVGTYAALTEADIAAQLEILRAWAAANPVRTYRDDFFERMPDAPRGGAGWEHYPKANVDAVYRICKEKDKEFYCDTSDRDAWDKPIGYWNAPLGTWGEKE